MNANVFRSFAVAAGLLIITGCAGVPGGTVTSPTLQRDVSQPMMMLDTVEDPACNQRRIVNTEVIEVRPDGTWIERWTVDRCGKWVNYRVRLSPSPRGGTDFGVGLE